MRLTLRTLLAYMDDILEPADHEELGKKIESSDFATELIHRCRDTVRRLRLHAAVAASDGEDVLGNESTADANTVAEYLDNTLPPESVAEFERICLEPGVEADMHLAEVTSCHHILTMVLGEPAEIDVRIRERLYGLPTEVPKEQMLRIEPAHPGFETIEPPSSPLIRPAAASPSVITAREEHVTEVPDYLRAATDARRSRIRWMAAAVVMAMAAGIGYVVFAPVPEQELPNEIAQVDIGDLQIDTPAPTSEAPAATGSDSQAPPFVPDQPKAEAPPAVSPEVTPAPLAIVTPTPPVVTDEPNAATVPSPVGSTPAATEIATGPAPTNTTSASVAPVTPPQPISSLPTPPQEGSGAEAAGTPSGAPAVPPTETDAASVPPSPKPEGPVQLGNYLGGSGDVLLRRDENSQKWIRLPPRTSITSDDRLLVLPKFRTHVALADANIYLSGGTQLVLSEPKTDAAKGPLTINIVYGRLLLNAGLNGSRQVLQIGDQQREAKLGGSASLAVEVRRVFVPGGNLEQETAPIEAAWYLTSGSIEWPGQAGAMQTISAPAVWKTAEGVDELPQPINELPAWIDREEITDLERRARSKLAEELLAGEPVGLTLLELNDPRGRGRQREVRTLAAESSLYVGQFEPFVKSLSDTDQSRYWESHIDSLREALALSPALATQVREAFVDIRGQQAAEDLMEMVQGYSRQQVGQSREELQQGALVKLLGWLENDSLDYRVLAIYDLNEITGTSYLAGYRPDSDSTQRKRAVRKLWDRFEANELLPAAP